jgi:acetyl-CoA carboxylase biotin carboxyl carrier protein
VKPAKESKKTSPDSSPGKPSGPMDPAFLRSLVELMASHDLGRMELRDGEKRIVLQRGAAVVAAAAPVLAPAAVPATGTPPAPAAAPAPAPELHAPTGLKEIKSPMVGTFYSKPSPDAKPFVSVGSVVSEDTDVCVIEAMKVFNNIKAECRGTIARTCVQDGQAVEFGTVLFLVKP